MMAIVLIAKTCSDTECNVVVIISDSLDYNIVDLFAVIEPLFNKS